MSAVAKGADSGPLSFRELSNKHKGQPALIMVGGVKLPEHYKKAPKRGAVKISVNQHGVKLTKCDYAVYLDYNTIGPQVTDTPGPHKRITHGKVHVDYRLTEFWHPGDSAMLACWCAYQMGCAPIIVLGMDGYAGGAYWHDPDAKSQGRNVTPSKHLENWQREVTRNIPNAMQVIRAFDEPLNKVFHPYKPKEEIAEIMPELPAPRLKDLQGPVIKMLRNCRLGPGADNVGMAGEIVEVGKATLAGLKPGRDYVMYEVPE